jgi:hypothetical protein
MIRSVPVMAHGSDVCHQAPPPSIAASFNILYPELHLMKRYSVNLPLLRQDLDLPLFFVNEVLHPYCGKYEGQDCSSYSNNGENTLYYVSSNPFN